MAWKDVTASLSTEAALSGLRAVKDQMGKRRYKRLIATAVAQLLELHPDIGPRKARKRARRVTGARPSKKLLRAAGSLGLKEGAQGAAAVVGAAGLAKVVEALGSKMKERLGRAREDGEETDRDEGRPSMIDTDEPYGGGHERRRTDEGGRVQPGDAARESPAGSPS